MIINEYNVSGNIVFYIFTFSVLDVFVNLKTYRVVYIAKRTFVREFCRGLDSILQ